MIDNMWFDILQQTFCKMHFFMKIVTGVTFLMDNSSEDQYIRSYVCHWCYCVTALFLSVTLNK